MRGGKIPRDMFDPYSLLDERELLTMTAETAVQQIQHLAGDLQSSMSPAYYAQRLKAISILAGIAADRLANQQEE